MLLTPFFPSTFLSSSPLDFFLSNSVSSSILLRAIARAISLDTRLVFICCVVSSYTNGSTDTGFPISSQLITLSTCFRAFPFKIRLSLPFFPLNQMRGENLLRMVEFLS